MSKGMDEVKLGPGWMPLTRKTGLASTTMDDGISGDGSTKKVKQRFAKQEVLALYRSGQPMPREMKGYAGITVMEPLVPVNLSSAPAERSSEPPAVASIPPPTTHRVPKPTRGALNFDPKATGDASSVNNTLPSVSAPRRAIPASTDTVTPSAASAATALKRTGPTNTAFGQGTGKPTHIRLLLLPFRCCLQTVCPSNSHGPPLGRSENFVSL